MTRFARIPSVVALLGLVGCGKSPEQQQIEQIQKNAQQMAQSAAQMSNNAQDVAKGFEAMARGMAAAATGAAAGNIKPVDPVDFQELQAMLPDVAGWEKSPAEGERMTAPVSFAFASTRY